MRLQQHSLTSAPTAFDVYGIISLASPTLLSLDVRGSKGSIMVQYTLGPRSQRIFLQLSIRDEEQWVSRVIHDRELIRNLVGKVGTLFFQSQLGHVTISPRIERHHCTKKDP